MIGRTGLGHLGESTHRHGTVGVVLALAQCRADRAGEDRPGEASGAVIPDVAGHLSPTHGEPEKYRVPEIEMTHQCIQVGCKSVIVIPTPRLVRTAETSPVVGDDAVTVLGQSGDVAHERLS